MMAPAVTVNVLFAAVNRLADNLQPIYILTDGQFGTNTLGMLAFNSAFGSTEDLGLGAAVTVVLLVVAVCIAVPLAMVLRYRERRLLHEPLLEHATTQLAARVETDHRNFDRITVPGTDRICGDDLD